MNRMPSASSAKNRPGVLLARGGCGRTRYEESRRARPRRGSSRRRATAPSSRRTPRRACRRAVRRRGSRPAGSPTGSRSRAPSGRPRARRRRGGARRAPSLPARPGAHRGTRVPMSCQSSIPTVVVQQRDRGDGRRAREVGDDARRPEAEPVDDDAAEERREHDREEVEEDGEAGERRASGRGQDVPGDRELRDGISRERDRVRGVQRVERRPPRTAAQ